MYTCNIAQSSISGQWSVCFELNGKEKYNIMFGTFSATLNAIERWCRFGCINSELRG